MGLMTGRGRARRFLIVGGVTAFSPADIAGLQLWLDANDASTLFTDAAGTTPAIPTDVVGQWADKSGLGNNATQSTTAAKPLVSGAAINGLNTVLGDGTDDELDISVGPLTNETIFVVSRHAVNNAFGGVLAESGTQSILYSDDVNRAWYRYNSIIVDIIAGWVETDAAILRAQHDGTNAHFTINNLSPNVQAAVSSSHTYINLFSRVAAFFLQGDIAEILVYNSFLSPANVALVENYLSSKWGVTIA